jgi:hypothetical protein
LWPLFRVTYALLYPENGYVSYLNCSGMHSTAGYAGS